MFPDKFSVGAVTKLVSAGTLLVLPSLTFADPLHKDELIIHYQFEEQSGEVAVDSSGNSNDGTIVGAPEWVAGKIGQALDLATGAAINSNDASGQHIQIPELTFGGAVTFSVWINRDTQTQWSRLFEFSNGANNSAIYAVHENTGNNMILGVTDTATGNPGLRGVNVFADDTWDHFAMTVSSEGHGTSRMEIFKNGISVSNRTDVSPVPAPLRTINYIGRSTGNNPYADMQIDDFRLYSIALSPLEISYIARELEDSPLSTPPVITLNGDETIYLTAGDTFTDPGVVAKDVDSADLAPVITYETVVASDSLVARWAFDGDLTDSSGNQLNGIHVNTAGLNLEEDGIVGKSLTLDGTNQNIRIPHSDLLKPTEAITISAWVKPTDITTNASYEIYRKEDGDDRHLLSFQNNGTVLAFGLKTDTVYTELDYAIDPLDFTDGEWHLITAVYADDLMEIYVDGVSAVNQVAAGLPGTAGTADAYIGSNNGGNEFFNGSIDDVRIYSIGLTADQVLTMWNEGNSEIVQNSIDTSSAGIWNVVYTATDANSVSTTLKREVIIVDENSPVITLVGEANIVLEGGDDFTDEGVTVADASGTVIPDPDLQITGAVDLLTAGTYEILYEFTDDNELSAIPVKRTVVIEDNIEPTIALIGEDTIKVRTGNPFWDPGVTATDSFDGELAVSSTEIAWNQLQAQGYQLSGRNEAWVNLHFNGGLMEREALQAPVPFMSGPFDIGMHIDGDQFWQQLGTGISRNDDYQALFTGVFRPLQDGDYRLGVDGPDDRASVWIDLDQDGRFEKDGDDGNEWMNTGPQFGYSVVSLEAGEVYEFAITYLEYAGGARIISYIDIPGLVRQTINPNDPEQAGYWGVRNPVDVNTPGTYTITYRASDRAGHEVTTSRTVIVDDYPDAPSITLQGGEHIRHAIEETFVDPGVLIKDSEGNEIVGATPTIGGNLDVTRPGFYKVTYNYAHDTDGAADTVVRFVEVFDNKPPSITLEGGDTVEIILGEAFVDPGVTITDNSGETVPFVSTADIPRNGLQLHVDATYLEQFYNPGDVVNEWADLSGHNRHMNDTRGEPTFSLDGVNGSPSVHFDAEDFMATPYHHGSRLYTVVVLAQFDGGTMGRLISSRDNINWLIGYHNTYENVAHQEGWVTNTVDHPTRPITENPHVFVATNTGASHSRFYSDGVDYTYNAAPNGRPGRLQFGGYQAANEPGSGYVSEAILYNRVITDIERLGLELYLNTKYGINGYARVSTLNTNKLGSYTITYLAKDSSGNLTTKERVVNVVPDSTLPVIELNGDAITLHEFGEPFVDPQAVAKNPAGVELQTGIDGVGTVDVNTLGVYSLTYDYTDTEGNVAQTVTRQVIVEDTQGPVMALNGEPVIRVEVGTEYIDEGATATDERDGELTAIPASSKPGIGYVAGLIAGGLPGNPNRTDPNNGSFGLDPLGPTYSETKASPPWAGNFTIIYTGQIYDEDGLISFTENIDDQTYLTVGGEELLADAGWNNRTNRSHDFGEGGWFDFELRMSNGGGGAGVASGIGFGYDPEGGTNYILPRNSDANTPDLFRATSLNQNSVNTSEVGNFSITFTATDSLGNESNITRTVIVVEDTSEPFIGLEGEAVVDHEAGTPYTDSGAKGYAGDGTLLNGNLVAEGSVDISTPGSYELTYNFTDGNDVAAERVTRIVNVIDSRPPEITLNEFQGQTKFVRLFQNQEYSDPGATSQDLLDGDVTTYTELEDVPNSLNFSGFYANFLEDYLYFDQPGSLLDRTPRGSQLFREPLHYIGDAAFINAFPKIIARNDQFQNLWYGTFTAKRTGEYEFQLSNVDDRGTIWIDLDNDGIFSHDGGLGDERLNWGNSISRLVIEKGTYLFAIGHMEGGGGSGIRALFRTPEDAGPFDMVDIDPSSPEQAGIWTRLASDPVDTSILGRNLIRYYSVDAAGNFSMAERVIVVEIDKEKPVIALLGDPLIRMEAGDPYYDPGSLLYDYQGNELDENLIIATNVPDGFQTGDFVIEYNYTDEGGHVADTVTRTVRLYDTIAPEITLIGVNPVTIPTGTAYVDPGAKAIDRVDGNLLVSSNLTLPLHGLAAWYTFDDGSGSDTLKDETQNNDATLHNFTGSEWVTEGKVNGALHFNPNGENNQYAHAPAFDIEGEFSVSAWVKYDSFQNWSRIIDFGNGANADNLIIANVGGGTQAHWGVRQGGTESSIRINNFWEQGVWIHVVGTVNRNNEIKLYKDGQLAGTQINGHQPRDFARTNQFIGRSNWGNDRYFQGMMDELMLYNRALTEQDILQIYNGVEPMDTSVAGVHEVTYIVTDSSGNTTTAKRTVNIVDTPQIPTITLNGDMEMEVAAGPDPFADPGYIIKDANDEEIQGAEAAISGAVDMSQPGSYTLVYDYTDAQDNSAPSAVRNIRVIDQGAPIITLVGGDTIEHQLGNEWIDPGFSAEDFVEGEITVSTSEFTPNAVLHSVYVMDNVPETLLNFDQNTGLLTLPTEGATLLTNGPRNEGVHFDNDAQFRSSNPAISRDDNFQSLFTGHFNSKVAGIYEFGIAGEDDRAVFWMDLDQDGIFEIEGDNGNEWINGHYAANFRQVELDVGYYAYAIGHIEYGGGSNLDVRWHTISGSGPRQRTFLNPSASNQDGLWIQYNPVNVKKRGTYTITYTATDSVGNTATATRTVIVDSNPDAPVITLNGEAEIVHPFGQPFSDPMAVVKDVDGVVLDSALAASSGSVDHTRPGEYELAYTFVDQSNVPAKTIYRLVTVADITPPVISLVGDAEITHFVGTPFTDPGATAVDDFDGELRVASSELFTTDGLVLHLDTANIPGASEGDPVMEWLDLSPAQNHVVDVMGTPTFTEDGIHGFPGVYFDGASSLAAPNDVGNAYTVFTVSKLTGTTNGRLFSSATQNLILGYWNNRDDVYHPNAWVTLHDLPATTDSHLYIHTSTGRSNSRFWSEKGELTMYPAQGNGAIGKFQMGAWQNLREPAAGVVSEVLVFDRFLKSYERLSLQSRLSVKYGFTEVPDAKLPVNRDKIGDYVILYSVEDSNGNLSTIQRTVRVIADPDAPVITLSGDELHHHELATPYADPGYTLTNAQGDDLGAENVVIQGEVDANTPGTYKLTYNFTDENGKSAPEKIRFVQVYDTIGPVITLEGKSVVKLKVGTAFVEEGFSAVDLAEGAVAASSNLVWLSNQLKVTGYMIGGRDNNQLNFENDGGLLSQTPVGTHTFRGNIVGLNGDAAFREIIPEITRNDDYQLVFQGYFQAQEDGDYEFGIDNADDRCSFWIDLDQDDVFESAGDNGSEVVFTNYNGGGWKTYTLTKGYYRVAIGFMEHGGGAWVRPRVRLPNTGGRTPVDPGNVNLPNLWLVKQDPNFVDINTPGTYTINYTASDSVGNVTTVQRTIVVVEDETLPFISLKGGLTHTVEAGEVFEDPGAIVTDENDTELEANLQGTGDVDVTTPGEYQVTYEYTHPQSGKSATPAVLTVYVVDTTKPSITLTADGDGNVDTLEFTVGEAIVDPGFTATDNAGQTLFTRSSLQIPVKGLMSMYRFDELTGSIAYDDVGGRHATLVNMADDSHVEGIIDNALYFSGVANDAQYMDIPDFEFGGATSLAMWVHYEQLNNWSRVLSFNNGQNNNQFFIANNGGSDTLTFDIRQGGNRRFLEIPGFWQTIDWIHVTATVSKDGHMKVYKNGVLAAELIGGHPPLVMTRKNHWLGLSAWGNGNGNDGMFQGKIDHLLFYERELSAKEALALGTNSPLELDNTRDGIQKISYLAADLSGNVAMAERTIVLHPDPAAPVLSINSQEQMTHEAGTEFIDPGVTAKDLGGTVLEENIKGTATLLVSYWPDSSGMQNHISQADPAMSPTLIPDGFEGKPTLQFHSGATLYNDNISGADSISDLTFIAVHDLVNPQSGNWTPIVGIQNVDNAYDTMLLQQLDYAQQVGMYQAGRNGNTRIKVDELYGPRVSLVSRSGGTATGRDGQITVSTNGTVDYGIQGWDTNLVTSRLQIAGRMHNNTGYMNGKISEVIVLGAGIAEEDRQKAEGHLAHKWGLADSLPLDHPYKDTAPDQWTPENLDSLAAWFDATTLSPDNVKGEIHINYEYSTQDGKVAIPVSRTIVIEDTTPPEMTLEGDNPMTVQLGAAFEDPGVLIVDTLDGELSPASVTNSNPFKEYVPGLLFGNLPGNNAHTDIRINPGNLGNDPLGPSMTESTTRPPWITNYTFYYTGEIYDEDGVISFYEHIRERVRLSVGTNFSVLSNADQNNPSANSMNLGQGGWYPFELKVSVGGGAPGRNGDLGFGYDPAGGTDYVAPQNSNDTTSDLFRYLKTYHDKIKTDVEGEYTLTYTAIDSSGNESSITRTIIVKDDPSLPVLTFMQESDAELVVEAGSTWEDPGYQIHDRRGEIIDGQATITGTVDTGTLGTYTLLYDFELEPGKSAPTIKRTVTVVDTTPPVIELIGGTPFGVKIGDPFVDPGATVTDNLDTGLTVEGILQLDLSSIVAHWSFDDGTGLVANDDIGGHHGALMNFADPDAHWVDGKHGKAIQFDGTDDYILIPGTDKLDLQEFTISFWMRSNDYSANMYIFEKTADNTVNSQYSVSLQDGSFIFRATDNGFTTNNAIFATSGNLTAGQWHHIATTFDGTVQRVYLDDELIVTNSDVATLNTGATGPSYIGAFAPGNGYFFRGVIDDVRVYNEAIQTDDIPGLKTLIGIDTSIASVTPYIIDYTITDSSGNTTTAQRAVIVSDDSIPPVIALVGEAEVTIQAGGIYEDLGATATDNIDSPAVLGPRIVVTGLDQVDTDTPGEYTISYDLKDLAGNSAITVTRKVIVEPPADPFLQWVLNTPLNSLGSPLQALDADPDKDGIVNLIEYALGTQPTVADAHTLFSDPIKDEQSGKLTITYVRLKDAEDGTLTVKAQLTTTLIDEQSWDDTKVTESVDSDQDGLPSTKYERIKVEANTPMDSETAGRQFIRIFIEKQE